MTARIALSCLCAAALAAGCGGVDAQPPDGLPQRDLASELTPHGKTRSCAAGSYRPLASTRKAYAAVVRVRARAHARPGGAVVATFEAMNANRVATVFGIRGAIVDQHCKPRWFRVQLPMKPNGRVGYVRPWSVWTGVVRTRIVVDLSERRLTYFRNGRAVLRAKVAVGSPETPTPTGRYYVNQRLIPTDTSGPFGPGAIGISAFSDVLTGWAQGGPIAIHGTNRPESIGRAVSNGCLRLPNATLRKIFHSTLAGTPVIIHP